MNNVANLSHPAEHRAKPRFGLRPPPRRNPFARKPRHSGLAAENCVARDGQQLIIRPIRVDDVEALQRFFGRLTPAEIRMRFLHPMNELTEPFAYQLCDLDPDDAFAWVLADPDENATPEIYGVARGHADRVLDEAEFAIIMQGRFARQGFGSRLMRHVIESARSLGVRELWSDVLIDNGAMLALSHSLGFTRSMTAQNPGVLRVRLALNS
jgi:RimJ/RimL family protein N-acetyltransferase